MKCFCKISDHFSQIRDQEGISETSRIIILNMPSKTF